MIQLSYPYRPTGKTIALTIQTFLSKVSWYLWTVGNHESGTLVTQEGLGLLPCVLSKCLEGRGLSEGSVSIYRWWAHSRVGFQALTYQCYSIVYIVLVTQLCPTLCDPTDCNPPGSSVHGILQTRILEWVAISFSKGASQTRDQTQVSWLQADSLPESL